MIDFIYGKLIHKGIDYALVDHGGLGFRIYTSVHSLEQCNVGDEVHFFTYMVMREDGISLYGFVHEREMDMFQLLITIKGVGPKVAIGILSGLRPTMIEQAIVNKDVSLLTKAPGVGKKTAERIILELKDKVNSVNVEEVVEPMEGDDEILDALMSLGYGRSEAVKVLPQLDREQSLEDRMKQALKSLMK